MDSLYCFKDENHIRLMLNLNEQQTNHIMGAQARDNIIRRVDSLFQDDLDFITFGNTLHEPSFYDLDNDFYVRALRFDPLHDGTFTSLDASSASQREDGLRLIFVSTDCLKINALIFINIKSS